MFKNPFRDLDKFEKALWLTSVAVVALSYIASGAGDVMTAISSLIGVTALIFVAKGYVLGQILTLAFSVFYGIVSFCFGYYGEMLTYLGMTAPVALMAVISWLRHPYNGTKEVEVSRVTKKQRAVLCALATAVTVIFYFILSYLNTKNIIFSTISVTTSFVASYLTFLRSPYYAVGYAANDIVLIVLWAMASVDDIAYLPMVICFVMFFVNDLYGYYNWSRIKKRQSKKETVPFEHGDVKIIAHRGVSGIERENTLPAFIAASERSYYGIETDVRITKDKKFVLLHNPSLEEVTGGRSRLVIKDNELEELMKAKISALDGSYLFENIKLPTLSQYLGICKKGGKVCIVELKDVFDKRDIEALVTEIKAEGCLENTVFISFERENCVALRSTCDNQIQLIVREVTDEVIDFCRIHRLDIDAKHKALTCDIVSKLHQAGLKVNCWTVNDKSRAAQLCEMGVDYITTNILE